MALERQLDMIVGQVQGMVEAAAADGGISAPDLRRLLRFLTKVVQVADQAFQDVYATLFEFKYLTIDDVHSAERLNELTRELDLLQASRRYRDAEGIASRLHQLNEQYSSQIAPIVENLDQKDQWYHVFQLLHQYEGHIMWLFTFSIGELGLMLEGPFDEPAVASIRKLAAEKAEAIRGSLVDLERLRDQILGLSGEAGFLELTETDRPGLAEQITVLLHQDRSITYGHRVNATDVSGQVAVGSQITQTAGGLDLSALVSQLSELRSEMKQAATDPAHDIEIGAVASAQVAARSGNERTAMEHLAKAGKWALDIATRIGASVAAAALKAALDF